MKRFSGILPGVEITWQAAVETILKTAFSTNTIRYLSDLFGSSAREVFLIGGVIAIELDEMTNQEDYGAGDSTYQACGGEEGIERLVDEFYCRMEEDPQYYVIWQMHSAPREVARSRLSAFLCGWMGGPWRYAERYGSISIPSAHAHIAIGHAEKGQWLSCMGDALFAMKYPDSLVKYLLSQFEVPAERIRLACERTTP